MTNRPHQPEIDASARPAEPSGTRIAGVLLPPPPPGVRYVRVPVTRRVVVADDRLRDRIDCFFHWPMIILALAILPLLAWEFFWPPQSGTWQWWASAISLGVIWLAFFVEFTIKVAIAECRFEYAKRNWLDIVVLCLPLLRPLRVATVVRTSRVYALRGVGMKLLRYGFTLIIGLEMTDRLLERVGVKRTGGEDPRVMTRHALIKELKRRRAEVAAWESWYADYQAYYHRVLAEQASRDASADAALRTVDGERAEADETNAATHLVRLRSAAPGPSLVLPAMRLVRPPDSPPTGPAAAAAGPPRSTEEEDDDESSRSRQSTA